MMSDKELDVVAHTLDPCTWGTEAAGALGVLASVVNLVGSSLPGQYS